MTAAAAAAVAADTTASAATSAAAEAAAAFAAVADVKVLASRTDGCLVGWFGLVDTVTADTDIHLFLLFTMT